MPTSYGDHLDRAAKSLCKDVGVSVSIELFNTQAIKVHSLPIGIMCRKSLPLVLQLQREKKEKNT